MVGVGVVGRVGLGNELAVGALRNGRQVRQLQGLVFHCHHIRIVYLPVLIDSDVQLSVVLG